MLVLSRKNNEGLRIGEGVKLKVLAIRGGVVRLGIEAPNDTHILRFELEGDENGGPTTKPPAQPPSKPASRQRPRAPEGRIA